MFCNEWGQPHLQTSRFLLLGQLWPSGGGDPLRPGGRGRGGGRRLQAGGSINGDENCPHSFLMSLCFKEKTVSKPRKGKALNSELKEDLFPGPRDHRSQWDTYTEMHLPSASPSVRPKVDTRSVDRDRWRPICEISDLWAESENLPEMKSPPKLDNAIFSLAFGNYLDRYLVI